MTTWQRRVRLLVGVSALALAGVVAWQFKGRPVSNETPAVEQVDTQAIAQTERGRTRRFNLQNEEVSVEYEKLLSYADGTNRMQGLTVVTKQAGDRIFTIKANEGRIGKDDADFDLNGNVTITSSDGINVKTEHATYVEAEGMVRTDRPVEFTQGATSGSGIGATYDKRRDVLTILDKAVVRSRGDETGKGRLSVDAGTAEFVRPEHTIRFSRHLKVTQDSGTIEADSGLAHLSADEQHLDALELRSGAKIDGVQAGAGTLKSLAGQEIDLKYAPAGSLLQSAAVRGNAGLEVFGDSGQGNRQISAATIDIVLAADGTTPTTLAARSGVRLVIPPGKQEPGRTITADTMDGKGQDGKGLTGAVFNGKVRLEERGSNVSRNASSGALEVTTGPGLSTIDEARFTRAVRFEEGTLVATAAAARYQLAKGTLQLRGSEPGSITPRVVSDRMDTGAKEIDVTLDGPIVHAVGGVQSTLRPAKNEPGQDAPKVPAMLKADQEVSVTADDLAYDGGSSRATYSGHAVLFQGETKIRGAWVALDDKTGNLSAGGGVTTTAMLKEEKDGKVNRVPSTGTSKDFVYEDATRKATYSGGESRLVGPQGDVRADTIALFLKASGDEVDRAEARTHVVIIDDKKRKSTGDELKYFSADDRYELVGKPVVIVDECARPTEGLKLTFFQGSDRIILDGTFQNLTRTRGDGTACP